MTTLEDEHLYLLPDYISFSSFSTWAKCQEEYRLTRILRVEEGPAIWFAGGSAFHSGCDAIDYALLADQEVPF
jgi:hypothetical protein